MKNKVFRHELKYLMSEREAVLIRSRLREKARIDEHAVNGSYFIRSLYFDDLRESAYGDKQAGTSERRKFRIRIYNYSDDVISLECKEKKGSYILKRSGRLSKEELDRILSGDYSFLPEREESVLKEFYISLCSDGLRPSVMVDYDRVTYVFDPGTVRITFDENIRSGFMSYDLFDKSIPVFSAMDPGMLIMEVKFTEYLPDTVKDLIEPGAAVQLAASKFVMCSDVMRDIRGFRRTV